MTEPTLNHSAAERFKPFQDELLKRHKGQIHSITITGSALTDFGRFYVMIASVSSAAYYEVPEAEKAVPKVKF
jgi:hypothetical protein